MPALAAHAVRAAIADCNSTHRIGSRNHWAVAVRLQIRNPVNSRLATCRQIASRPCFHGLDGAESNSATATCQMDGGNPSKVPAVRSCIL